MVVGEVGALDQWSELPKTSSREISGTSGSGWSELTSEVAAVVLVEREDAATDAGETTGASPFDEFDDIRVEF